MAKIEIWKPVPGHGNMFVASSFGRIARVAGYAGANGYRQISMVRSMLPFKSHSAGARDRRQRQGYVHHLIALAFHGQPPEGVSYVNHKDFDRSNNRPENLEWCSQRENVRHAWAAGRVKARGRNVNAEEIEKILELRSQGRNYNQISKAVGCCTYTVGYQIRKYKKVGSTNV